MRKIFRDEDKESKGLITKASFMNYMDIYGITDVLDNEQMNEILDRFGDNDNFKYHYFLDEVFHNLDRPVRNEFNSIGSCNYSRL